MSVRSFNRALSRSLQMEDLQVGDAAPALDHAEVLDVALDEAEPVAAPVTTPLTQADIDAAAAAAAKERDPLHTIASTIPAEGIGAYLALYSIAVGIFAFVALPVQPFLGWACVLVAIVVTVAFNIATVRSEAKKLKGVKKKKMQRQGNVNNVLFSILCVIYIAATPQNPFVLFIDGFPEWVGPTIAAVTAVFIGLWRALKNRLAK